jgi:sulfate adenylyltransferase
MKQLILNQRQINELELLLDGSYYPVEGYMVKQDYESCLYNMRLSNGKLYPIPVVLSVENNLASSFSIDDLVLLKDETNYPIAELTIQDIYEPNLLDECKYTLGTNDSNHPYCSTIMQNSNQKYLGGKLKKINMPLHYDFKELRNSPQDIKKYIKENNYNYLIGFQTRNVLHRSHYELTLDALSQVPNAKLLLHPVVGFQDLSVITHRRLFFKDAGSNGDFSNRCNLVE